MLKKTTERTKDETRQTTTITHTYKFFGITVYVRIIDYALARDFPAKA